MPHPLGIKRYGISGLKSLVESWNEPPFRATQLLRWLYADGVSSYLEMTNLPASLRSRLEDEEPLASPQVLQRQVSKDGTRKYLLLLADGQCVESVGIPDRSRLTVCFSTQVGCAMGCAFCATGTRGLIRSLEPGEMVDQLTVVSKDFSTRISNAVAMGEGEPFLNYDATLSGLRIMNSSDGLNIGSRHLTVSTCGLINQVEMFAHEPEQFTLAVSLHSAVQKTRDELMPALVNQPLDRLKRSLVFYTEKTGRRPSLEVVLLKGINDTSAEVSALIDFSRGMLCHINLIPFNSVTADTKAFDPVSLPSIHKGEHLLSFEPSETDRCHKILSILQKAGIECSIRRSRGADIQGACGQLKGILGL